MKKDLLNIYIPIFSALTVFFSLLLLSYGILNPIFNNISALKEKEYSIVVSQGKDYNDLKEIQTSRDNLEGIQSDREGQNEKAPQSHIVSDQNDLFSRPSVDSFFDTNSDDSNENEQNDQNNDDENKEFDERQSYFRLNFAAVGDWDCNSITKDTIENLQRLNPKIILGLGDYSYGNSADCWLNLIEPIADRMKIVIGNHESESSQMLADYMDYFNLQKQYYSFNFENIHFIALSTEVPYDEDSAQYDFALDDLKEASEDPLIDWIIVFFHRNAYGASDSVEDEKEFAETYGPLFNQYQVDVALQAHSHFYERFFPMKLNSDSDVAPIGIETDIKEYNNVGGTVYITVGTGGADPMEFRSVKDFSAARFVEYGVLNFDLVNNGQTLVGNFYANNDNEILDSFKITKYS